MLRKPEKLQAGDRVGIFLPSSPVREPYYSQGLKELAELGFVPVPVSGILAGDGFMARPPRQTLRDLNRFFASRRIKGLWAGRGGYGANHLLSYLAGLDIAQPKVVIGSSDVSYLLWHLLDHERLVVFFGPMVFSSLAEKKYQRDVLLQVLGGVDIELRIPAQVLKKGRVKGVLSGGCLSNLVSLIGTPYLPCLRGKVVILEDINERPYRLDRMIWQLLQAGVFKEVKAVLLGEFPGCFKDENEKKKFFERLFGYFKKFPFPVLYDLPLGHSSDCHTVPLGVVAEIDTAIFPGLTIKEKGVV